MIPHDSLASDTRSDTSANPVRNVSDTALWVAVYRAIESERGDALFRDPYARRLAGARGQAIVDAMPDGVAGGWPMVVRTAVMDEILLRCIGEGTATVLNLAAGLDTRPYRLELPRGLRWLHVDTPQMVDYFRTSMAGEQPRCDLQSIGADLRDAQARRDVFTQAAAHGPVLAVTEGLLIYLDETQVADLARDLHQAAAAQRWLTDLASPRLRPYMERRHAPKLREGNAPLQFFPAQGTAFFERLGWKEIEFRSTWQESLRLQRTMRGAWLMNLLSKLQPARQREEARRMSGIVLFEAQ